MNAVPSPPAWAEREPDPPVSSVPLAGRLWGRLILALGERLWGKPHPLAGRDLETLRTTETLHFRSAWNAYLAPVVAIRGALVLDVGCGRGGKTAELGRLGARLVIAVDREEAMLRTTRDHLKASGVRGAVVLADAARLPFREGAFDVVLSQDTAEHLEDLPAAVAEMGRVMSTNGKLCIGFAPYPSAQGSHLGNFVALPWCHLLVPHPLLLERVRQRAKDLAETSSPEEAAALRQVEAWERYHFKHCLLPLTLKGFERAIRQAGLHTIRRIRTGPWRFRPLLYLPWWSDRVIGEQVTVHVKGPARPTAVLLRAQATDDLRRIWLGLKRRIGI